MNRVMCCLMAVALVGCRAVHPDAGSGPITLSPVVAAQFEKYKKDPGKEFFLVSADGRQSLMTYCRDISRCVATAPASAIATCETASKGVPCKIFAVGDAIVWDGGVSYAPLAVDAPAQPAKAAGAPLAPGDKIFYTNHGGFEVLPPLGKNPRLKSLETGEVSTLVAGLLSVKDVAGRTVTPTINEILPLGIGKSATARVLTGKNDQYWTEEVNVVARERITVPAGTFECFKVTILEKAAHSDYEGMKRVFVDDTGTIIKSELEIRKGKGTSHTRELVKVVRAPK